MHYTHTDRWSFVKRLSEASVLSRIFRPQRTLVLHCLIPDLTDQRPGVPWISSIVVVEDDAFGAIMNWAGVRSASTYQATKFHDVPDCGERKSMGSYPII